MKVAVFLYSSETSIYGFCPEDSPKFKELSGRHCVVDLSTAEVEALRMAVIHFRDAQSSLVQILCDIRGYENFTEPESELQHWGML